MSMTSTMDPQFRGQSNTSEAQTYGGIVLTVLRHAYAARRHASKLLARDANASPRTAEKWLSGETAPSGENLIELMASCQELADEINRLVQARRARGNTNNEANIRN